MTAPTRKQTLLALANRCEKKEASRELDVLTYREFAEYPDAPTRQYRGGFQNSVFQTYRYTAAEVQWL